MDLKYIYIIAIIIVILVILLIYNYTKENTNLSDNQNTKPNVTTAVGATSMKVMCNSLSVPYSFTISITDINGKTLSNTITSSSAGIPSVIGDFVGTGSCIGVYENIGGIQYTSNYLNIYKFLAYNTGNNTRFAVQDIKTYITSITDTNTNTIAYDVTTGSVFNNKLTFTSGNDSLTIVFKNYFQ